MFIGIQLTINGIRGLPKLGLTSDPSPYLMIHCEEEQHACKIVPSNCNPVWNHQCNIKANQPTSLIHFLVYNNNPIDVDELLAFCSIEVTELCTRTITERMLRLRTSKNEITDSYLTIEHCDSNVKERKISLLEGSSIKIILQSELLPFCTLNFKSKKESVMISNMRREGNIQYDSETLEAILCMKSNELKTTVLVNNIDECTLLTLVFNGSEKDYKIQVCFTIVRNALLPENFHNLNVKLENLSAVGKIKINGPLNFALLEINKSKSIYIENHSNIEIEYFTEELEPIQTISLSINSLSWSKTYNCKHEIYFFDSLTNEQIKAEFDFNVNNNKESLPKLERAIAYKCSIIELSQIRLTNCYLYEILNPNTKLMLVYKKDKLTVIDGCHLKESGEILFNTKIEIEFGGIFILCTFDYIFGEKKDIYSSTICTFKTEKNSILENFKSPIIITEIEFSMLFIAFAKKVCLVKECKKYAQMKLNNTLRMEIEGKNKIEEKKGLFTILNIRVDGDYSKLSLNMRICNSNILLEGITGEYLLKKPKQIEIYPYKQGVTFKLKLEKTEKEFHKNIGEMFGTLENNIIYLYENILSSTQKLKIIYTFDEDKEAVKENEKEEIEIFETNSVIKIKLIKAYLPSKNVFIFRLNRGKESAETFFYSSQEEMILFSPHEEFRFENEEFIFFSASSSQENYNGHFSIKQILGKGLYEICLTGNNGKNIIIHFKVLNKKLSCKSLLLKNISCLIEPKKQNKYVLNVIIYENSLILKQQNFEMEINKERLILKEFIEIRQRQRIEWELVLINKQKEIIGYATQEYEDLTELFIECLYEKPKEKKTFKICYEVNKIEAKEVDNKNEIKLSHTNIDVYSHASVFFELKSFLPYSTYSKSLEYTFLPIEHTVVCSEFNKISKCCLLEAINMEIKLEIIVINKRPFEKKSEKIMYYCRNKHFKLNYNTSMSLEIKNIGIISFDIKFFYNEFVLYPKGILKIMGVEEIELETNENNELYLNYNKELAENTAIKIKRENEITTFSRLNCIKYKLNGSIKCIPISMISFNNECETIRFSYIPEISLKEHLETLNYIVLEKDHSLNEILIKSNKEFPILNKPPTEKGFKAILSVPTIISEEHISLLTKEREILLRKQNNHFFKKNKIISEKDKELEINEIKNHNLNHHAISIEKSEFITFEANLNHELEIVNLIFSNKSYIIGNLGKTGSTIRFLIDQDPKKLCTLNLESSEIPALKENQWTFTLSLHKIYSNSKILYTLKDTPYDEILCKKFSLLIKHANQYCVIRNIDKTGHLKEDNSFVFGYDASCNTLEIILFIQNCFNEKMYGEELFIADWPVLMAVAYDNISLSTLPQSLFASVLKEYNMNSDTFETPVRELIIPLAQPYALFGITFNSKHWTYLSVKIKNSSCINTACSLSYKISLQKDKQEIASLETEVRKVEANKLIYLSDKSLDLFLIEEIKGMYYLKIILFRWENTKKVIAEKIQEVTEYIYRRGKHSFKMEINAFGTYPIEIEINNNEDISQKNKILIPTMKNNVDRGKSENEDFFILAIINCQDLSQIKSCFEEIREFIVYHYGSLKLVHTISLYCISNSLIVTVCEIVRLAILKKTDLVSKLPLEIIYKEIRRCILEIEPILELEKENYDEIFKRYKATGLIENELIRAQCSKFKSSSIPAQEPLINLLVQLFRHSDLIQEMFNKDITLWIEKCIHKNYLELFLVLIDSLKKINQEHYVLLSEILLSKEYKILKFVQYWQCIEDISIKAKLLEKSLKTYAKMFCCKSEEKGLCSAIKIMLATYWEEGGREKFESLLTNIIDNIIFALIEIENLLLNSTKEDNNSNLEENFIDFLMFLNERKHLEEPKQKRLIDIVKRKIKINRNKKEKFEMMLNQIERNNENEKLKEENTKNIKNNNMLKKYSILNY